MRNLKRVLSLTLASVMLMGMMVMGSSAAAGYDDVAETDNVEAIEVLQAIEVMVGDERGFGPERPVNRAEMAVVMGKLLSLDYNYYTALCPFTDVYDWAQGWVGACYANKIVSGRGDGIYDPGATVTAVEAASMLMRALGYFQYQNDYADGFELSTVTQGKKIGIFDNVGSSASEPMTRNQVAQMVLNALQSGVVEPDGNTINLTTPDGTVLTGKVNYVFVTSNKPFATAISGVRASSIGSQNDSPIVELGERLYDGKLKLTDDYDPFGRPARNWEFDGKNIGVYAKKELVVFEYVGGVTGKDLYDVLGSKTIEDYELTVNLDGVNDPAIVRAIAGYDGNAADVDDRHNVDYVFDRNDMNRNNKAKVGATGTGVLTQVYVDHEKDTIDIAIINTYLALADKDYDSKKEELAVTVYDLAKHTASGEYVKDILNEKNPQLIKLAADEFPVVADAAKDEAFLLTVAEGKVQTVVPAEVLAGVQVSSFKKNDNVVVGGTTYKFDTTARFDGEALKTYTDLGSNGVINLKDLTYNVYLDTYGNLIGIEEVEAVKNYVFITAIDLNDSNLVNGTADARAIFLDGTVDTIRVNMGKSDIRTYTNSNAPTGGGINKNSILNTWCTFTKNNSDVYTLTQVKDINDKGDTFVPGGADNKTGTLAQYHETVADGSELTIDKKHITLKGKIGNSGDFARVYGDEETVYLTAELDELTNDGGTWGVISGVETVSIGIEGTDLEVWTNGVARTEADDDDTDAVQPGYSGTDRNWGVDPTDRDWSKGVYTLYDDDGVIIAAVVVGEDNGSSRNLVYVHSSSVEYEAYDGNSSSRASDDGLWTWTRKVISNGAEVTLTEVSEGNSYLARMSQYYWYQVKTNGKGEVIAAYKLPGVTEDKSDLKNAKLERFKDLALDYKNNAVPASGSAKIGEIAYTVQNGKNTVLYFNEEFIVSRLNMIGRTLYVATDDQTGFIVDKNVNYVLQQWNNNKKDTFIEEGSGSSSLESVIKEINDRHNSTATNGVTYTYRISAVLENGVATSVVIYDYNNDYVRPGNAGASSVGNVSVADASKDLATLGKNTKLEILSSGDNTLTVEIVAPDWAKDANTGTTDMTAIATLLVDGKAYERIPLSNWTSVTNGVFSKTFTNNFVNLGNAIFYLTMDPDEHTFAVQISDVKWKYAGVKYYLGDKDVTDEGVTGLTQNSDKLPIDSGSAQKTAVFTFDGSTAAGDGYTVSGSAYEITGAYLVNESSETLKLKGTLNDAGSKAVAFGNNGIYANNGWVTVKITGVTKTTTSTPETTKYTVESRAEDPIQFAMVETLPTNETELNAVEGWQTKLDKTAVAGQYILVRSATGDKLAATNGLQDSNIWETYNMVVASPTVTVKTDLATYGVYAFEMPAKDLAIKAVKVDRIVVEHYFIDSNGTKVNMVTAEAPTALDTPAKKLEFAAEWITKNVPNTTAKADKDFGGNDVLVVTRNGQQKQIPVSNIHIAENLFWVNVVGKGDVVADDATALKTNGVLSAAGITGMGNYYVKVTAAAAVNAVTVQQASDSGNDLTKGDTIDTNNGAGYIKLTLTVVEDGAGDPSTMLDGGTVTGAIKNAADGFVVTNGSTTQYVKKDVGDLAINLSIDAEKEMKDTDKTLQAKVTSSDATIAAASSGDDYSDFADVKAADGTTVVETGYTWKTTEAMTITVKVTPTAGDVTLTVTLKAA